MFLTPLQKKRKILYLLYVIWFDLRLDAFHVVFVGADLINEDIGHRIQASFIDERRL